MILSVHTDIKSWLFDDVKAKWKEEAKETQEHIIE